MLNSFAGKHVLLLQGPMGPFFRRLAKDLENAGARVSKINFCPGDALFYPTGAMAYRGAAEEWPAFLAGVIEREGVNAVLLFGDCRPHHCVIRQLARWLELEVFVFEEGYLRPDYLTIERDGVNNFSPMPRVPEDLCRTPLLGAGTPPSRRIDGAFLPAAVYASVYCAANYLFAWRYPHYRHHRSLQPLQEGVAWLRGAARKYLYLWRERRLDSVLTGPLSGRYFLVPLQVHNDAQVTTHSGFGTVEEFILRVTDSFAEHAPPEVALVFKHHPMDRAYRDYSRLLRGLADRHRLGPRLLYVHDLHLPSLLRHARGTVVINSTVGLSSLHHGTPVMVLGKAVYDIPGLTFGGPLERFWREPGTVDRRLYGRLRAWFLAYNQANGSFYRPIPEAGNHAGVLWPSPGPCAVGRRQNMRAAGAGQGGCPVGMELPVHAVTSGDEPQAPAAP